MKTIPRHAKSNHQKTALIGVSILLGAGVLVYTPLRSFVSGVVYTTAPRIWSLGDRLGGSWQALWGGLREKQALVAENTALKESLARSEVLVLDRNLLEERVIDLEEKLGRAGNDDRVTAQVIAGGGQSPYDTLIIDAGSDQGVRVNNPVVYAGKGVVGEVVEVYSQSAKVALFSTPGSEHKVLVGDQHIPATAQGRGMGNFETHLPEGSTIAEGQSVLAPEGDLLLGIIGSIEKKPADPFIRVLFRSPWNTATIHSVEVVMGTRRQI